MGDSTLNLSGRLGRSFKNVVFLCIMCILINMAGSVIVGKYGLILYLDSIGTVLAAVLGGVIPGIFVGLVTNFVKVIADPSSIYYGVLNVLIAVATAYFSARGLTKKLSNAFGLIIVLAFIGGGLGSVLTWFLYGFAGEGVSVDIVKGFYQSGVLGPFQAQLCADLLVDLADKAVTVLIVILILKALPDSYRDRFYFVGWHQAPLTEKTRLDLKNAKCRGISLRTKLLVIIIVAMLSTAFIATVISYMIYYRSNMTQNKKLATGASALVAGAIDPEKVDDFLENGEADPEYRMVEAQLQRIKNSAENIRYVYVYKIDAEGCHVVLDLDTDDVLGQPAGTVLPFEEAFYPILTDLLSGKEIEPIISDDTYGWLLTSYTPVYDSNGECVCYAGVDLSIENMKADGFSFLARLISLFLGFFIMVLAIGVWLAEYNIILPVNTMARAAGEFEAGDDSSFEGALLKVKELRINTGDELENLYHSIMSMAEDSVWYMNDIKLKNDSITKMQRGLIFTLADLVESRDENTGQHVRKTAAYTMVIMDELVKEGIYTDVLTPEYMRTVRNAAPLHDIGKIVVPDAILNKPGKLTDEEFAIMKTHAAAGRDILARAMETLPDQGYLEVAKELAAYHHEKWNGKGYPDSLAGEEIPLCARIMAVADVFDALVSKRSYKEGMPLDKAFSIIEEGIGEHFDPKIAQAFINARDIASAIAEGYLEQYDT